jgi:hypothetical protein
MNSFFRKNTLSAASAVMVLAVLPAWIGICWRQRSWIPAGGILIGGPAIVLAAVMLAWLARRRQEPLGLAATLLAGILPAAVFVWMNFVGNP